MYMKIYWNSIVQKVDETRNVDILNTYMYISQILIRLFCDKYFQIFFNCLLFHLEYAFHDYILITNGSLLSKFTSVTFKMQFLWSAFITFITRHVFQINFILIKTKKDLYIQFLNISH